MKYYDKACVTFHRGNGISPEGVEKKPFAKFTTDALISADVIDAIVALVREQVNTDHADCCNIKLSTEDWDV